MKHPPFALYHLPLAIGRGCGSAALALMFNAAMETATVRRVRARGLQPHTPAAVGRVPSRGVPRCGVSGLGPARPTLRLLRVVGPAILALLLPLLSRADISATAFESANKLYEEGKFSEAATAYAKLLQTGQTSAALYFNLGNAFFKSGQIGRAIAAYRLAGQMTPRDPDVRANLQFARNQTQGPTLSPNRWQRWLGRLTLNEWTVLAAWAVWLWLVLLAVLQWRPGLRPALRRYVVALAVAALSLCGLAGAAFCQARLARVAIVITKEADVRNGPLPESKTAFTAHDGAELRVLDQKDDWLEVSAGPRETGWLRRDQVLMP